MQMTLIDFIELLAKYNSSIHLTPNTILSCVYQISNSWTLSKDIAWGFDAAHRLSHDRESVGRNFHIKSSAQLILPPFWVQPFTSLPLSLSHLKLSCVYPFQTIQLWPLPLREVLTLPHRLGHDRESVGRKFRIKSSAHLISPPFTSLTLKFIPPQTSIRFPLRDSFTQFTSNDLGSPSQNFMWENTSTGSCEILMLWKQESCVMPDSVKTSVKSRPEYALVWLCGLCWMFERRYPSSNIAYSWSQVLKRRWWYSPLCRL